MPNSISVLAAAQVPDGAPNVMRHLPSYYSQKIAYGPAVVEALKRWPEHCFLDMPLPEVLRFAALALDKHVRDVVVMILDRPRHADMVRAVRETGAALRLISDGDITAAVAPSMPGSGIDLYVGMGGSPEAILAAAALKCLGGDMEVACGSTRRATGLRSRPRSLRKTWIAFTASTSCWWVRVPCSAPRVSATVPCCRASRLSAAGPRPIPSC